MIRSLSPGITNLPPLSILRMFWKRKVAIAALCIGLCLVSGGIVYKLPPRYKAEALVLVDEQKIPEKFVSATVNSDVGDRLATISQQIMSSTRLLKIIHDFDLYKEERKRQVEEEVLMQMRKDISLHTEKGWANDRPGAFRVGYQGSNAIVVAQVANQLANFYVEQNLETREIQAEGTAEFIDSQLNEVKRDLNEQESKVAKFKQEHNGSLPEQQNPLLSALGNLQVQLQGVQDTINREQQSKLMIETALSTAESSESAMERTLQTKASRPSATVGTSTPVSETSSIALERRLEIMRSRYTPDHPDIVALEQEIARIKRLEKGDNVNVADAGNPVKTKADQLTSTESNSDSALPLVNRDVLEEKGRVAMLRTQLSATEKNLRFQEQERQRVIQSISATQSRVEQLPLVEQRMSSLTRDYEISKANYKSLLDKKMAAAMATDMERRQKSERFEVIDPARVPETPFSPNRPLWFGLAAVLSLALALATGFGLEWRRSVLLGEWEMPASIVVLGRVPKIRMFSEAKPRSRRLKPVLAISSAACSLLIAAIVYYMLEIRS